MTITALDVEMEILRMEDEFRRDSPVTDCGQLCAVVTPCETHAEST
jgi:hypothetical protein